MTIQLNGKTTADYTEPLTVSALLAKLALDGKPVVVELNGVALRPREYGSAEITDGAKLEIVQVAAGG